MAPSPAATPPAYGPLAGGGAGGGLPSYAAPRLRPQTPSPGRRNPRAWALYEEDEVVSVVRPLPDPTTSAAAVQSHYTAVLQSGVLGPQLQPEEDG